MKKINLLYIYIYILKFHHQFWYNNNFESWKWSGRVILIVKKFNKKISYIHPNHHNEVLCEKKKLLINKCSTILH